MNRPGPRLQSAADFGAETNALTAVGRLRGHEIAGVTAFAENASISTVRPVSTRFFGGKGNQVAVDRRVQAACQRRAGRAGHLVVERIHQTGIAAAVQFVAAVFRLHGIASRLAFMRDEDQMGAEMVAVSLAAFEHAARAIHLDVAAVLERSHRERAGHAALELQRQNLPVHGIVITAIDTAAPRAGAQPGGDFLRRRFLRAVIDHRPAKARACRWRSAAHCRDTCRRPGSRPCSGPELRPARVRGGNTPASRSWRLAGSAAPPANERCRCHGSTWTESSASFCRTTDQCPRTNECAWCHGITPSLA